MSAATETRPIVQVWAYFNRDGSCSTDHQPSWAFGGTSPSGEPEFVRSLERNGHAILLDSRPARAASGRTLSTAHHTMAGCGVGHDDAKFCETGGQEGSMAAYYENGEAFRGERWWTDSSSPFSHGVKHYGMRRRPSVRYCGKPTPESEAIRAAGRAR